VTRPGGLTSGPAAKEREHGAAVPRPRAIVVISAHWYIGATSYRCCIWPMTAYTAGLSCRADAASSGAALLPPDVPADSANI
jgi:hypothetical protein